MNKIKITLISLFIILFFTSCGGGGGNGSLDDSCNCETLTLSTGETVNIYPGDQLSPSSGNAIYNVVDVFGELYKQVTIIQGSVELIYGSYNITDYPR